MYNQNVIDVLNEVLREQKEYEAGMEFVFSPESSTADNANGWDYKPQTAKMDMIVSTVTKIVRDRHPGPLGTDLD